MMKKFPQRWAAGTIVFAFAVLVSGVWEVRSQQDRFAGALLGQSTLRYETGAPRTREIWVDPKTGNDARDGSTRAFALKTLGAAWRKIPENQNLGIGFRINLARGEYSENAIPNYLENRRGSQKCPVIIRAVDGRGSAILRGDLNVFNCTYFYLMDLTIAPQPAGDTLHFEKCENILVRGLKLDGGKFISDEQSTPVAHDNLKANQCKNLYVEDCEIFGAGDNAVDFVAVHGGHIVRNKIHNANDWGAYVKGGSANFVIEGNEIWDCGTGGFTAGQGTGFQWMRAPFLKYEAENIRVQNNYIHDCRGAGLGVNGGFNIVMQNNTLSNVGARSHMAEFVFGGRSCDGAAGDDRSGCAANLKRGGWGTTRIDDGDNFVRIPNKNVYFFNNVLLNDGAQHAPQLFTIFAPYDGDGQNNSNAPRLALADENLQIKGNMIWNSGHNELGIGEETGCRDDNAACNAAQLQAENFFEGQAPQLKNKTNGDYRVLLEASSPVFVAPSFSN